MNIKRENNTMIMSQLLVCENYLDMKQRHSVFERVGDNEYKCTCGTVMRITRSPIVFLDNDGRLRMQVVTEPKKSTIDTFDFDVNGF